MASASAGSSAAAGSERIIISWIDMPPDGADHGAVTALGSFKKQSQLVNGHPCYINEAQPDAMLWFAPNKCWVIGLAGELGTDICGVSSIQTDVPLPEKLEEDGPWKVCDRDCKEWLPTNAIKLSDGEQ